MGRGTGIAITNLIDGINTEDKNEDKNEEGFDNLFNGIVFNRLCIIVIIFIIFIYIN